MSFRGMCQHVVHLRFFDDVIKSGNGNIWCGSGNFIFLNEYRIKEAGFFKFWNPWFLQISSRCSSFNLYIHLLISFQFLQLKATNRNMRTQSGTKSKITIQSLHHNLISHFQFQMLRINTKTFQRTTVRFICWPIHAIFSQQVRIFFYFKL